MAYFIDTNIFIRYLTRDQKEKAEACEKLFAKHVDLITSPQVIMEILWTLEKYYRYPKRETVDCIIKILNTKNLECDDKELLETALVLWLRKEADFIDVFNACFMDQKGISEIYSYDLHFDQLNVRRLEP
jgi:predicted nucleic-acid-binding protein